MLLYLVPSNFAIANDAEGAIALLTCDDKFKRSLTVLKERLKHLYRDLISAIAPLANIFF
ncbi:hypothetical protein [Pseudanabaena yagii]|uniref:Uncharacterized protein n=1 Tax=Pseudanabaena yagii GIHE-NHR1 TaxID=2722753 RepID=A0ABX1LPB1_9CYAN|nr:hypothetical protein [Pseudanabaena yagii]NMF57965.1 hypothetical protein [Pseudanabaena yagii GIHE-NHR1]